MERKRVIHKKELPKNYYNYFDICKMEGIEPTKAKNAVSQKKVEGIKYLKELAPIEYLFEQFEKPIKGGMVNSYGIMRNHYDYWKRTGEVPQISPGRPPKWKGNPNVVNINIPLPKNLYEEFQGVIDKANDMSIIKTTYRDMIAVAISEFIARRPNLK